MKARLLATIILAAASTQALALNARTWVSGKGVDGAGCGPIATPCRSLQFGHDQTNPNGEIDVLDSAGYGSVVITKAITIIGDGVVAGVLAPPGGVAIDIAAGASDTIVLRGLTIEGQGSGIHGIRLTSGRSITIANCVVLNVAGGGPVDGNAILIAPSSGTTSVAVSNTAISGAGYGGLHIRPTGTGSTVAQIDRVTANRMAFGIAFNAANTSGTVTGSVSASVVTSATSAGILGQGAGTKMMIDGSSSSHNLTGFQSSSGATVYVGGSTATKNAYGFAGNATMFTYRNNQIDMNTTDVGLPLSTATLR